MPHERQIDEKSFSFSIIPQDQIVNGVLVLSVYDYDFISANDFEGEAMVRLTDLPRNSEQHVKWTMALHRPEKDSIYKVCRQSACVLVIEMKQGQHPLFSKTTNH